MKVKVTSWQTSGQTSWQVEGVKENKVDNEGDGKEGHFDFTKREEKQTVRGWLLLGRKREQSLKLFFSFCL